MAVDPLDGVDLIPDLVRDDVVRRGGHLFGGGRQARGASGDPFCGYPVDPRRAAEEFGRRGIICRSIFGDAPKDERDAILAAFKRGQIRVLASMGVLTTGFDAPGGELIALLRPVQSADLYVQMVGRAA